VVDETIDFVLLGECAGHSALVIPNAQIEVSGHANVEGS